MAKFMTPVIQDNPSGWGPCAVPEQFRDMPYQPFSKGDRLGKVLGPSVTVTLSSRDRCRPLSFRFYSLKRILTPVLLTETLAGNSYSVWVLPVVTGELGTWQRHREPVLTLSQTASSRTGASGSAETCLIDLRALSSRCLTGCRLDRCHISR